MFYKMDEDWPRRAHFEHYMHAVRCTYSLTVHIEITKLWQQLKERGWRTYPALIYLLAAAVNQFPEFRMGLTAQGEPGCFDRVHPAYTIFHEDTKTFSSIWTPYEDCFAPFYDACTRDMAHYAGVRNLRPQADMPANVFDISALPWIDFTAFDLNVYGKGDHLLPIFTLGRYTEREGRVTLPLAMQLHHAACDGYHAGLLVQAVRALAEGCKDWL